MAEKKKILYIVEAMGGGVFTYIVDLANELVNQYDLPFLHLEEFVIRRIQPYLMRLPRNFQRLDLFGSVMGNFEKN